MSTSATAASQPALLQPSVAAAAAAAVTAKPQAAGKVSSTLQPGLHAEYVGEYTEQHDEDDVDILGGSDAVSADLGTHAEPAAAAAGVPVAAAEDASNAVGANASEEGAVAPNPAPAAAYTPAPAVPAPAEDAPSQPAPSKMCPDLVPWLLILFAWCAPQLPC